METGNSRAWMKSAEEIVAESGLGDDKGNLHGGNFIDLSIGREANKLFSAEDQP